MSTPFRSKLIFSALGLFLPGTGFNCFYLLGIKSFWGWIQLTSLIAGILGFLLLNTSPESSAAAWVLIVLGFIALEASWLSTIVFGLRPDEKWDAQFNQDSNQTSDSNWLVILCVILSLMIGAAVMMTGLAVAFEQHFLSQFEEARKISQ
ncbi:MAG: hypothetical protein EBZ56_08640 [Burkholderiaceae bacterium]|nr:hypothetical protein [Burkholderiaceae bacterium]